MLTNFQNSFTDRLSSKVLAKKLLNIPPHLEHIPTTLPCEMFVLENRNYPELPNNNFSY